MGYCYQKSLGDLTQGPFPTIYSVLYICMHAHMHTHTHPRVHTNALTPSIPVLGLGPRTKAGGDKQCQQPPPSTALGAHPWHQGLALAQPFPLTLPVQLLGILAFTLTCPQLITISD